MVKYALQRDGKTVQVNIIHPTEEGSILEREKGQAKSFVFLILLLFNSHLVIVTVGSCNTWMDRRMDE